MPEFTIVDDDNGMEVTLVGDQAPDVEELPEIFGQARKHSENLLSSGEFKLGDDLQHLDKPAARDAIRKHSSRALGISPNDIDIDSGMGQWERAKLAIMPDDSSRMDYLEKKFGGDNVASLNVDGTNKMFYRDPKTKKFTMVDEQGSSFADFTSDLAGAIAPIAGSIVGAVKGGATGAVIGSAVPGVGTAIGGIVGTIGGAAAGGFGAGLAQDVAAEALTGQDLNVGKHAASRVKEAALGAAIDVAFLGTSKLLAKPFLSKITGDASSRAFADVASELPEGALTPRMMQGEEAITREVGMERQLGGRVGDARKAIDQRAREVVSQSNPVAYDRFAANVTKERDDLLAAIPAGEKGIAERVNKLYNDKLQGFGSSDGRTLGEIGKDVIKNSVTPALKQARTVKNQLYSNFDSIDKQIGGVFAPKALVKRFETVIARNRLKNNSAINSIKREIELSEQPFSIGEVDDLISRVTDAMPEGVIKDKTAQQLAADLSDSLSSLVRNKAKKFPELNSAWRDANKYYKDTFLRFNRGSVGGVTKDKSGDALLSPQSFIKKALSDAREVSNILSSAKVGGQSPSIVKGKLKEAFLTTKGIQRGGSVNSLALTPNDADVVKELWGRRGLNRLKSLERGLKASPEKLDEYLGALSEKQAKDVRDELIKQSNDIKKLESLQKNAFMKSLADGNLPSGQDASISKAFLSMPRAKRIEALSKMKGDPESIEHLKGMIGAQTMFDGVDTSPFRDAMGEHLFNGTAALGRLNKNKEALVDVLGKDEFSRLHKLAVAQDRLKPLSGDEATAKLRTLAGGGGISFYIVGDLISSIRNKFVSLAYRTKALDPLMSGWSQLDKPTLDRAMRKMLYGAQSKKALELMDDPELEANVEALRIAFPEQ